MYQNNASQSLYKLIWVLLVVLLLLHMPNVAIVAEEGDEAQNSHLYLPLLQRAGSLNPVPPTPVPPTPVPPTPVPPTPVPDGFGAVVFGQDRFLQAADVATDDQGNIHYIFSAVSANNQTDRGWHYAFCAPSITNCDDPGKWQLLDLGRTDSLVQLEVTGDGRPRLWLKSTLSARPTFSYGECNHLCSQKGNWQFVDLLESKYTYPSLEELGFRHESFALDPQGRPRFVYFHVDYEQPELHGMRYAFCNSNCTSLESWDSARISSSQSLWRPALGFTPAGQPRIVASSLSDKKQMMYVQCDAGCEGAGSWPSVTLFNIPGSPVSWSLQVDPTNGAIRVAYKQNMDSEIWFMWCGGDCLNNEKWDGISLLPSNAPGGRNPALALDAQGRPYIAYEYVDSSHNGLGYLWCTGDCYTLSTEYKGVWEDVVVEDNGTLLEEYPLVVPAGCKDSTWLAGLQPALAMDKQGRARFAFEADGYSYCNKGSKEDPWWVYGQYWGTSRVIFER
jgi:hypothetical protein